LEVREEIAAKAAVQLAIDTFGRLRLSTKRTQGYPAIPMAGGYRHGITG
jgi:hypothetical protein